MCKTIVLSTVATFTYTPDVNLLKKNYARTINKPLDKLTKVEDWELKATEAERQGLIDEEAKL